MVPKNRQRIRDKVPRGSLKPKRTPSAQMKTQVSELVKNTEKAVKTEMNSPRCVAPKAQAT
jgi:hypothetical protein